MKPGPVRDGAPHLIYDRLFCVRARCTFLGMSYHQSSNQLRKRRLRSFLTGYSATDNVGSSVMPLRAGFDTALHRFTFYAFTRFHVLRVLRLLRLLRFSCLPRCFTMLLRTVYTVYTVSHRFHTAHTVYTAFTQPARCPLYSRAQE